MTENGQVNAVERLFVSSAPYGNGTRCGGGGCPAIYATDKGSFFVVGRRLSEEEKSGVSLDSGVEDVLEIPAELLQEIVAKLRQ